MAPVTKWRVRDQVARPGAVTLLRRAGAEMGKSWAERKDRGAEQNKGEGRRRRREETDTHFAEGAEVEAVGLGVAGAGVHVVADEQHQLQQRAEAPTLAHLLAGRAHRQDVRPDVVHLLLELQPEQDGVQPRPQPLHAAHLEGRDGQSEQRHPEEGGRRCKEQNCGGGVRDTGLKQ